MDFFLNGKLFCGKTERVPTHRMKDVKAVHVLISRVYVRRNISLRVPDVEPFPGRIREHVQHITFGLLRILLSFIEIELFPSLLPFRLDLFVVIFWHRVFIITKSCADRHLPT